MKFVRIPLMLLVLVLVSHHACIDAVRPYSAIAPGVWRAVLVIDEDQQAGKLIEKKHHTQTEITTSQFDEVSFGELPFLFEVIYDTPEKFHIEVINGDERIRVDDIYYGRDNQLNKDTVRIEFPLYDSYISVLCEERAMSGKWIVNNRKDYQIPFIAKQGVNYRFTNLTKQPKIDLSGKWQCAFSKDTDDEFPALATFTQTGNNITGTFQTETGDFRFLEGTIQDDKFYLSCFDGAHAFLFEGKILDDHKIIGAFNSGKHYKTTWEAHRNEHFALTDPEKLNFINDDFDFSFEFENQDGEMVALSDDQFQNKVTLVQIFGTWCPNCRDETAFLAEYIKKNPELDFEVVGLGFEKHRDKAKAFAALQRYKQKFDLPYDLLLAGYSNKNEASEAIPWLDKVISYPTLIFLDKSGAVRKIHTGFNGPATDEFDAFKSSFDQFLKKLISES